MTKQLHIHKIANNALIPAEHQQIRFIRDFAQLFRLPVAIVAALTGCATIYALNSAASLQQYLLTATILLFTHSASCAINDYWDIEKDRINSKVV